MNTIKKNISFVTPDGVAHKTWGAARSHMSEIELRDFIEAVTKLPRAQAVTFVGQLRKHYNISRRKVRAS